MQTTKERTMSNIKPEPISVESTLQKCSPDGHINTDLILTEIKNISLPVSNRRMECIFVALCLSGEGKFSIGTIEHKIKANDIIIIGEGQILGDINIPKDVNGIAMIISHDFFYNIIREVRDVSNLFVFSRETPVFSLNNEEVAMFLEYYTILKLKVSDQSHAFRSQISSSIIATMIYDLCNATRRVQGFGIQRQSRSQEVFLKFVQLVEQNFRNERHVSWYSEQLGVSPKTLLEMVKRVSQRTPNEWLDIYTTLEIRLLLRNTTKSIKEIADDLHFGTQSSLGKFFKEHVGVSPSAYRRE